MFFYVDVQASVHLKSIFGPISHSKAQYSVISPDMYISSLGNNMAPWTTLPDFFGTRFGTAHGVTL